MQHRRDVGFVIKRINVGEADRYVTFFTRENGKMEVIAKGVRKLSSRRASSIELLNLVEFASVKSVKNYVLTETKLLSSCSGLKSDYAKVPAVFLMCELIDKLCVENQPHSDIFNLLFSTIKEINSSYSADTIQNFQIELLSLLGFWDRKREYKTHDELNNYIETILERKIKTRMVFEV